MSVYYILSPSRDLIYTLLLPHLKLHASIVQYHTVLQDYISRSNQRRCLTTTESQYAAEKSSKLKHLIIVVFLTHLPFFHRRRRMQLGVDPRL